MLHVETPGNPRAFLAQRFYPGPDLWPQKDFVRAGVENKCAVGNLRAVKLLARWIGTDDNARSFVRISFAHRVASSLWRRILFRGFRRANWRCHKGASRALRRPRTRTGTAATRRGLGLHPGRFTLPYYCAGEN
jgi:hypothetical protein